METLLPTLPRISLRGPNGANFTCATCRHYQAPPPDPKNLRGDGAQGLCFRFPPHPHLAGMQNTPAGQVPIVVAVLPPVPPTFKCGEYARASTSE